MPIGEKGEWISRQCHASKHDKCPHEFDDNRGGHELCNCDCHHKGEVKIEITRYKIPLDPSIDVFGVEVGDDKSTWMETIPSEESLRWFLRGVQAGAQAYGNKHASLPEIPIETLPLPED